MRRPRGHFMVGGGDLLFMAGLWFLMFGLPMVSVAALIVLPILKIWFTFSWYWVFVPAAVVGVWFSLVFKANH